MLHLCNRKSRGLKVLLKLWNKIIKEKNYALRFQGKLGEKPKYTGRVLAVGISYSRKTKEHACRVEALTLPSGSPCRALS